MLKKPSVTKNCSDLSLFEWIVLVMEKKLLKFVAEGREFAKKVLKVGQNNFGNKIPSLIYLTHL